jgi:O-antigen/teichoic acid export membrane protein
MIFIVRILGKESFGQLGYVQATINMFVQIGLCQFGIYTTKIIAESLTLNKERVERVTGIMYLLTLVSLSCIGIVFVFTMPFFIPIESHQTLLPMMRIGTLLLILTIWMNFQVNILTGFHDYVSIAKSEWISGIANFVFFIGGTWIAGVYGSIVGLSLVALINSCVNGYFIILNKRKYNIHYCYFKNFRNEFKAILKFCLPLSVGGGLACLAQWYAFNMLLRTPNGYSGIAYLTIAMQICSVIFFLSNHMTRVLVPILAESKTTRSYKQRKKIFLGLLLIIITITFLMNIPLWIAPVQILSLYGQDFAQEGFRVILGVLLLSVCLSTSHSLNQWITANGLVMIFILLNIIWALVLLGTSHRLLQAEWGWYSVMIGMISAYIMRTILAGFFFSSGYLNKTMINN